MFSSKFYNFRSFINRSMIDFELISAFGVRCDMNSN